jgi:metal-responsive CopG/Arc/MetJ family transcriptional regulator
MRLHITLDDELVDELDSRVGRRQRSAFIAATIRNALDDERRWDDIEAGFGALAEREHEWDSIGVGARLATGNPKHFPMSELDVEQWPVGA